MTDTPEAPDQQTLDEIMDLNPINLTRENIDTIIAHQRAHRAKMSESVGRGRAKIAKVTDGTAPKLDLVKLGLIKAPAKPSAPSKPGQLRRV